MRQRVVDGDEITEVAGDNSLWCAMVYLAALGYPESHASRDRALEAMRAYVLRVAKAHRRVSRLPSRTPRVQQMGGALRQLEKRIRKRLVAAEYLSLLMFGVRERGPIVREDPHIVCERRWALRRAGFPERKITGSRLARYELGPTLTVNAVQRRLPRFKSDYWRPEVLHLAFALRNAIRPRVSAGQIESGDSLVWQLLCRSEWAPDCLRSAERSLEWWPRVRNWPASLQGLRQRSHRVRLIVVDC